MSISKIDYLNIGLIIISFIIAIYLPFRLFLLSYAIMGPLHYLTELNWLNKQQYFIKPSQKKVFVWIIALSSIIISIFPLYQLISLKSENILEALLSFIDKYSSIIIMALFAATLGYVFFSRTKSMFFYFPLVLIISVVSFLLFSNTIIIAAYFITTIIHVYLFTILFMIFGSMKSKSIGGWISSSFVVVVPILLILIPIEYQSYNLEGFTRASYEKSNFSLLGKELGGVFGILKNGVFYVLSEDGIKIQIFIAFAYTYHYLNWFSKTSIIGWGKALNRNSSLIIITLWIISVSLYYIDYKLGLVSLFFLSFLHVFAEFPLNWLSIKEIARSFSKLSK